jgi:hypothetical protein
MEYPIGWSIPSEEAFHWPGIAHQQGFPISREFPNGRCLLRARASYPPAEIARATKTVIAGKVVSPFFGRGRAASRRAHRRTLLPFENHPGSLPELECSLQSDFRSTVYRAITANGRATAPQSPVGSSTRRCARLHRLPRPPLSLPLPSSWLSPPWLSPPLSPSCCWF